MPRTPEQVAADQALTDAITAVRAAYDPDVDTVSYTHLTLPTNREV